MQIVVIVGLVVYGLASCINALCHCGTKTIEQRYCEAEFVYTGAISHWGHTEGKFEMHPWLLLKGDTKQFSDKRKTDYLHISTSGDCAFNFEKGEKYVVVARRVGKNLVTDRCMGTRKRSEWATMPEGYLKKPDKC